MSKKILLVIILLVVLVGAIILIIPKNNIKYIVIKDGYSDYESKIISNYQEYIEFVNYINLQNKNYGKVYNFNSEKYDEEYFDNKSLAIINIIIGNSSNSLKNIDISVIDNILVCKANIESGNGITDNINGKLILVEIDKSVTEFKIEK